jgi:hypothetical protein
MVESLKCGVGFGTNRCGWKTRPRFDTGDGIPSFEKLDATKGDLIAGVTEGIAN